MERSVSIHYQLGKLFTKVAEFDIFSRLIYLLQILNNEGMAEGRQPLNNIKYNRRLRRLKQKDLAWILEVHPTKISKLEKGVIAPDHATLDKLSVLLQVPIHELYDDFHKENTAYILERLRLFRDKKDEEENNKEESA